MALNVIVLFTGIFYFFENWLLKWSVFEIHAMFHTHTHTHTDIVTHTHTYAQTTHTHTQSGASVSSKLIFMQVHQCLSHLHVCVCVSGLKLKWTPRSGRVEKMRKMLPGVGVFGTTAAIRCLVPILKTCGFKVIAAWGRTTEEAKRLAVELDIDFHTDKIDEVKGRG